MIFEEMLKKAQKNMLRKSSTYTEHNIQSACVRWFRVTYPAMKNVLFAIPNAARRSARNGAYMKEEGMLSGVSDLILLKSNRYYGALCIEMKKHGGYQSQSQKDWQKDAEANGAKYVVCRSLDEFMNEVNNYIKDI